jgi:hypothetical protein
MAADIIERLNYYERQFLGAADFKAQQDYHRDMRRRHNTGHHTWGILTGLQLVERPREGDNSAVDIFILAGMATDGFGREILLLHEEKLDPALFDSFANLFHREVWIAFNEELTRRPATGYETCDEAKQFGRLSETFRIVVDPVAPTHDSIIVAGKPASTPPASPGSPEIPIDESVPYQELPDDEDAPLWLVRLGSVNWDGVNRKFIPAVPAERLVEGRRFVGIVAAEVLAPADSLRIMPRASTVDPDAADFAVVDGRLRVDGRVVAKKDVFLHGGKLSFQSTAGEDENHPLWLQRTGGGGAAGNDLRINIGVAGDSGNRNVRLSVGPPGPPDKVVLAVRADNLVDIPTGKLDFGQEPRQMINLSTDAAGNAEYGIGVQANTTYFRSHSEFCWFKSGVHEPAQSNPGGGTLQLRLDNEARLNFGTSVRQMLNLWGTEYGVGVQNLTLFFRSFADFCWFRGGSFNPNRSDSGGGAVAMKLDDQGRLGVGIDSPATKVHAVGNRIRLENAGKRIDLRADGSAVDLHSETSSLYLRSSGSSGNNKLLLNPFPTDGLVGIGTETPLEKLDVRGHIRLHSDGSLFALGSPENLRIVRGCIQSNGSVDAGIGFSVNKVGEGQYVITFNTAFPSRPSASVTQVYPGFDGVGPSGNTLDNAVIVRLDPLSLKVKTGDINGAARDRAFTFVVFGPR